MDQALSSQMGDWGNKGVQCLYWFPWNIHWGERADEWGETIWSSLGSHWQKHTNPKSRSLGSGCQEWISSIVHSSKGDKIKTPQLRLNGEMSRYVNVATLLDAWFVVRTNWDWGSMMDSPQVEANLPGSRAKHQKYNEPVPFWNASSSSPRSCNILEQITFFFPNSIDSHNLTKNTKAWGTSIFLSWHLKDSNFLAAIWSEGRGIILVCWKKCEFNFV